MLTPWQEFEARAAWLLSRVRSLSSGRTPDKDGKKCASRRTLTTVEQRVKDTWGGQYAVVKSIDEALALVFGEGVS